MASCVIYAAHGSTLRVRKYLSLCKALNQFNQELFLLCKSCLRGTEKLLPSFARFDVDVYNQLPLKKFGVELTSHLNMHNLIGDSQHTFRKGHSCTSKLLSFSFQKLLIVRAVPMLHQNVTNPSLI